RSDARLNSPLFSIGCAVATNRTPRATLRARHPRSHEGLGHRFALSPLRSAAMTRSHFLVFVLLACVQFPRMAPAQGLTGTLIGTVKDGQGGVLRGAIVRVTSPALIGGESTTITDE